MGSALVTGATGGIGRAIAAQLADAGWQVYAMGRDRHALEELRACHGVLPLALDLTDREACADTVKMLDVETLVHTAFRWPVATTLQAADDAELDAALEVNISASLHLIRALLPKLQRHGRIVFALPEDRPPLMGRMTDGTIAGLVAGLANDAPALTAQVHRYESDRLMQVAQNVVDDLCADKKANNAAHDLGAAPQERIE